MTNPSPESCREWLDDKMNYCFAPASFIVWGKLHRLDELGPRCMDHLPNSLAYHLSRHNDVEAYAAFDLRPLWASSDNITVVDDFDRSDGSLSDSDVWVPISGESKACFGGATITLVDEDGAPVDAEDLPER